MGVFKAMATPCSEESRVYFKSVSKKACLTSPCILNAGILYAPQIRTTADPRPPSFQFRRQQGQFHPLGARVD